MYKTIWWRTYLDLLLDQHYMLKHFILLIKIKSAPKGLHASKAENVIVFIDPKALKNLMHLRVATLFGVTVKTKRS